MDCVDNPLEQKDLTTFILPTLLSKHRNDD